MNSSALLYLKMNQGVIYAIIAAIAFEFWIVFHQQASDKINYLFGAIIISLTAVIIGLIILLPQLKTTTLFSNWRGIMFVVFAGICALIIDYFALKSYGSGLAVSIAGPITIGGSIAIAATIGFILGESITFLKVIGLLFVILGSGILASLS